MRSICSHLYPPIYFVKRKISTRVLEKLRNKKLLTLKKNSAPAFQKVLTAASQVRIPVGQLVFPDPPIKLTLYYRTSNQTKLFSLHKTNNTLE